MATLTRSPLDRLIDLVASYGMDRDRAETIANYLADRCAELSVATLHSSSTALVRRDAFLRDKLGLDQRQLAAWVTLLVGTRRVRRREGGSVGGRPGFIQVAVESTSAESVERFRRLSRRAAGCTRRAVSDAC